MLIVTWHTDHYIYRDASIKCVSSAIKQMPGIKIVNVKVKSFGSWVEHTHMKPDVAIQIHNKYPSERFFLVDADAIFRGDIRPYFRNADYDFSAHIRTLQKETRNYEKGTEILASGSLYFANNDASYGLVRRWKEKIKAYPDYGCGDQDKLKLAYQDLSRRITFQQMPPELCFYDKNNIQGQRTEIEQRGMNPIVCHNQISHIYKKEKHEPPVSTGRAK